MGNARSLDGLRMHVSSTDEAGVVNAETILEFTQQDSVVSARYAGGNVRLGFLVGTRQGDALAFGFVQIDRGGHIDGGRSDCEIVYTPAGAVRIIEHFEWHTRPESGTNVFDELDSDLADASDLL